MEVAARDQFIGWTSGQRALGLKRLLNDTAVHVPGDQTQPGESCHAHRVDPTFTAEFAKAVEAYGKAASAGHTEEAEAAALQMLSLAGEEAEHNPSPELLLTEQARVCEERGAWGDAEALYQKLLATAEASDETGHTKHAQMFQAHRHLCNLFLLLGEYAKAGESATAALAAARAADLSPLLIWALDLNAYCALRLQDRPSALAMAAEAVRTVEPGPRAIRCRHRHDDRQVGRVDSWCGEWLPASFLSDPVSRPHDQAGVAARRRADRRRHRFEFQFWPPPPAGGAMEFYER